MRTPCSRAATAARSGSDGSVGDRGRVELHRRDDPEPGTHLGDERVAGERGRARSASSDSSSSARAEQALPRSMMSRFGWAAAVATAWPE